MSSRGTGRLPTFKTRRDLTLGSKNLPVTGAASLAGRNRNIFAAGSAIKKPVASSVLPATASSITGEPSTVTKKKFTPNLNVQRKQISNENSPNINQEHGKSNQQLRRGQSGTSPKKREQKKTYQKPEFIQTMGAVFSEGIGEGRGGIRRSKFGSSAAGGSSRSGDGDEGANMQKPKLHLNIKVDKEAEAERLKELLRDDFIDDLTQGPLVPVQLPMIDTGTAFKEDNKEDINIDEGIKGEKEKNSHSTLDSDDDSDIADNGTDTKIKQEMGSVRSKKSVIGKYSPTKKLGKERTSNVTIPDLVRTQKGDLLFVQLPDHLPGSLSNTKQAVKQEKDILPGIKSLDEPEPDQQDDDRSVRCTLNKMPEGYLGKIQIRKSGKTQLLIGDTSLDVDLGTQVGFLQDLVSISTPTPSTDTVDQENSGRQSQEKGDMTVLGHVRHRLVVSPDWTRLFQLSEKQSKLPSGNNPSNSSSESSDDDYAKKAG